VKNNLLVALYVAIILAFTASGAFSQKISTDVYHPVIKDRPEPNWPASIKKADDFTVVLRAVFRSNAKVTDIKFYELRPEHPAGLSLADIDKLTTAAIEAAGKIRFIPATKNGRAVSMMMQLEYDFSDSDDSSSPKHKKKEK